MAEFFTRKIGNDDWVLHMENLRDLKHLLNDESALKEFTQIKRDNKEKLWWWVKHNCGVEINLDSMFDIQVKRIHEYKR